MSIGPQRSARTRSRQEWEHLGGPVTPHPRRDPDPIRPAQLHKAEKALIDAHADDGIRLSVHQAWLLLTAARDHLTVEISDYPYPTWNFNWQPSTANPATATDPRHNHPLVRAIANSLWPHAWDADNTSPEHLTTISLEHLAQVLGITLPNWTGTPA